MCLRYFDHILDVFSIVGIGNVYLAFGIFHHRWVATFFCGTILENDVLPT
jgi:hypothetical protein